MILERIHQIFMSSVGFAATTSVGQGVLKFTDKCLYGLEQSCLWSIPQEEFHQDPHCYSLRVLIHRPLPWVFFIPALLFLRVFKGVYNFIRIFLGYKTISKGEMVLALQNTRKILKGIKSSGIKTIRQEKQSNSPTVQPEEKSATESVTESVTSQQGESTHDNSKLKYSQITGNDDSDDLDESDENSDCDNYSEKSEAFIALLDRVCQVSDDSVNDVDFEPGEERNSPDTTATSETNLSVSSTELAEILDDAHKYFPDRSEPRPAKNEIQILEQEKALVSPEKLENSEDPESDLAANGIVRDSDVAYYSPISWKSISPERSASPVKQEEFEQAIDCQEGGTECRSKDCLGNGSAKDDSGDDKEVATAEVPNGHMQKRRTVPTKSNSHKHKHSGHGSRSRRNKSSHNKTH